jgi:hypothetical protein
MNNESYIHYVHKAIWHKSVIYDYLIPFETVDWENERHVTEMLAWFQIRLVKCDHYLNPTAWFTVVLLTEKLEVDTVPQPLCILVQHWPHPAAHSEAQWTNGQILTFLTGICMESMICPFRCLWWLSTLFYHNGLRSLSPPVRQL